MASTDEPRVLLAGPALAADLALCKRLSGDPVPNSPREPEQMRFLLKRALESRELARIRRYLSRELKFADAVPQRTGVVGDRQGLFGVPQ